MNFHAYSISNCVGYANRKFYMLYLFYMLLALIYCAACSIYFLINEYIQIYKNESGINRHTLIRSIGLLIQIIELGFLFKLFKSQLEFVFLNSSSID